MMHNGEWLALVERERQQTWLQEAETRRRLHQEPRSQRVYFYHLALCWVGRRLISWGYRLVQSGPADGLRDRASQHFV